MIATALQIRCLGGLRIDDPAADRSLGRGAARELLGVLASRRGAAWTTSQLVDALWPEGMPPPTAPTMVHGAVRRLRRAFGDGVVATRGDGYVLDPASVQVDLWDLEDLLAAGRLAEARLRMVEPVFGPYAEREWAREVHVGLVAALRGDRDPARPAPARAAAVARLVGRRRELAAVRDALARSRLVSLVGLGGVGKTRLATELVVELTRQSRGHGVRRADLGRGSGSFAARLLEELGVVAPTGADVAVLDATMHSVVGQLARTELLVLDGAEHATDAADGILHLLARLPGLRVVVTSRLALGLPGEHVVPVLPFEEPGDPRGDAVELLLDRVRALGLPLAADDRERAGAICARCAGVPLAIELAAAELLQERLSSSPDAGTATATAVVVREAVHDALAALSVRAHTFGRRAALMPAGVSPHLVPLLDVLGSSGAERELLAAGMLEVEVGPAGRRFHLPDTLREVLGSQADDDDRDAAIGALVILGEAALSPFGASPPVDRLVPALAEIPNSFGHLDRMASPDDRLHLAIHYRTAWGEDGRWARGEQVLQDNLAAAESARPVDPVWRAEVVAAIFNISASFESHARLHDLAAPAAEVAEAADRLDLIVLLRYAQAVAAGYLGRADEAMAASAKVRAAADRSGEELLVLRADGLDALGLLMVGRPSAARDGLVAVADRCLALDLPGTAARVRYTAATAARIGADLDQALADARQAEEEAAAGLARANLAIIRAEIADLRRSLGADPATVRAAYRDALDAAATAGQLRLTGLTRLRLGSMDGDAPTMAQATLELLGGDHKLAAVGVARLARSLGPLHPLSASAPALVAALHDGPGPPLGAEDAAVVAEQSAGPGAAVGAGWLRDLEADLETLTTPGAPELS